MKDFLKDRRQGDRLILVAIFILNLIYVWPFIWLDDKSNIFSAPIIPLLARVVDWLTPLSLSQGVSVVLAFFFALAPVLVYFFAWKTTGRRLVGLGTVLFYSLPANWLARGRIKMAFLVGDGGHVASLSLMPVASLWLLRFLREGGFKNLILTSLVMAAVALMSPFGLMTGLMVLGVITFSELLQGHGQLKIIRFIFSLIFTVGLVGFWYNPGFIGLFLKTPMGETVGRTFWNLIPLAFVVLPVLAAFGFLLFEKRAQLQPLFIALGLSVLFGMIAFADYMSHFFPSHPRRYLPELGLAISFLIGILAVSFSDYLQFEGRFRQWRLTVLGRQWAKRVFWLLFGLIFTASFLLFLPGIWELPEAQVLGVLSGGLVTSSFWDIREETSLPDRGVGVVMTVGTLAITGLIWRRFYKRSWQTGV